MADELDPLASIINHCHCSASQEDLFTHSKFAREDQTFAGDDVGKSLPAAQSGEFVMELNHSHDVVGGESSGFFAVCADCEKTPDLGFPGEGKGSDFDVVSDNKVKFTEHSEVELEQFDTGKSIEPPTKKSRVSDPNSPRLNGGKSSPSHQCTEKMEIDSVEVNKNEVMINNEGDLKLGVVSPLPSVITPHVTSSCTENLDSKGEKDEKAEVERENLANNKPEFGLNMQEINNKDDGNQKTEANVSEHNVEDHGSSQGIEKRGKRMLPSSLLGDVWRMESDGGKEDGVTQNGAREGGSINEGISEENGDNKCKVDGTMKLFLDVLKILAIEKEFDGNELDIFETAKKHGMTFPPSRFRFVAENGEKLGT